MKQLIVIPLAAVGEMAAFFVMLWLFSEKLSQMYERLVLCLSRFGLKQAKNLKSTKIAEIEK